jgi:hypothetical protein
MSAFSKAWTGSALVLWLSGHAEANHVWMFGISVQTWFSDGEQRMATRIATMLNLWVFGTVRREKQMCFNLRGRDVREHPCMPNLNLGVKWSQVQMLSARTCQPALSARRRSEGVSARSDTRCRPPYSNEIFKWVRDGRLPAN